MCILFVVAVLLDAVCMEGVSAVLTVYAVLFVIVAGFVLRLLLGGRIRSACIGDAVHNP